MPGPGAASAAGREPLGDRWARGQEITSGAAEARRLQGLLPLVGEHQVDERLRRLGVRRVGEDADRVLVDRLLGLGELDALDVGARALHVGA